MKCVLMNKNTEVLVAEYDAVSKFFDKIIEVRNIDYAPYILKNFYIKDDYIILKAKLKQLIDIGINKFGILLNDIDYFKGAGYRHAELVNDVYNFLKINLDEFTT